MEHDVMKSRLSAITGVTDESLLLTYLDLAGDAVLKRRFGEGYAPNEEVPERYHSKQLEIAVYLLNKRGAEGQTVHNENGVNRTYESAGVPFSMVKDIIPLAKSLGGERR